MRTRAIQRQLREVESLPGADSQALLGAEFADVADETGAWTPSADAEAGQSVTVGRHHRHRVGRHDRVVLVLRR